MKNILSIMIFAVLLGACVSESMREDCRPHINYSDRQLGDFTCGFFAAVTFGSLHW